MDAFNCFAPKAQNVRRINQEAGRRGLVGRLEAVVGDIRELPFARESLDMIWSKGAIYFMGFPEGIQAWWQFLRPGGFLAVSEAVWLKPDPPAPVKRCWEAEYPAMTDAIFSLTAIFQALFQQRLRRLLFSLHP